MRFPFRPREKAACIKLRRDHNWSITQIAQLTRRSTSVIHRTLKRVGLTGYHISGYGFVRYRVHHRNDLRKTPWKRSRIKPFLMDVIRDFWMPFITGEEAEPP